MFRSSNFAYRIVRNKHKQQGKTNKVLRSYRFVILIPLLLTFFADRGHINQSEIERVKEMITILLSRQYLLSDVVVPSDDTLCTICYSQSISATFHPCKHQSCCGCITQHLMNSKLCFYCKATIATVINFDGNCVFEQISESSEAEVTP